MTERYQIIQDDCINAMRLMQDNSIDFIVTDPPYGLSSSKNAKTGFMGKKWDANVPGVEYWAEILRICKPGSILAAFGGTRTYHRLACAIEDAGWEIRDCMMFLHGQGFPKSHNFGKHIGGKWTGYGTALKPSFEPIIICKKPYEIMPLFVIVLLDITNEVYKCQKLNSNVKDVELDLSDSLLLLDRVHQCIVQDHAKISAWEKLSSVDFVIKNFIYLKQGLKERINQEKDLFVPINAKDNGNEISLGLETQHGREGDLFASIQDIVICVSQDHIKQNIVLLWKNILIELFREVNKFTIKMAINLITDLKILKYYLLQSTSKDTGNLCPNYEPIILAMKPIDGTYAQNAEKWGVAGINIDASRINFSCLDDEKESKNKNQHSKFNNSGVGNPYHVKTLRENMDYNAQGRWPSNLLLDEEAAALLDQQTGILKSGEVKPYKRLTNDQYSGSFPDNTSCSKASSGGASRFFKVIEDEPQNRFLYCAKASSRERNQGLEGMPLKESGAYGEFEGDGRGRQTEHQPRANNHPTVKPLALMRYIIKLLAPPGDPILLDCFMGSGSTLCAAKQLGIRAIGIELDPEYCEIARRRIEAVKVEPKQLDLFDETC